MKTTVKLMALALVLVMTLAILASCGKTLSGTYEAAMIGTGAELAFKGSKVTITVKAFGAELGSAEGKYSIDGDKITFTFETEDDDVKAYNGTFDFEEGENYIKVGLTKYEKK